MGKIIDVLMVLGALAGMATAIVMMVDAGLAGDVVLFGTGRFANGWQTFMCMALVGDWGLRNLVEKLEEEDR